MKKRLLSSVLLASMILSGCSGSGTSTKDKKDVKIGVIQYMQHDALDKSLEGFKEVVEKAGYTVDEKDIKNASGESSNSESIANTLVNGGYDLIYAIATPAAQSVANKTKDIPIVVSCVTDPEDAKLVQSNDKSGTNVCGASDLTPVKEQMDLLHETLPDAKTVGVMYCGAESNSEVQAKLAVSAAKKLGLKVVEKTVSDTNDIQAVADSFAGKIDALYVPTDNLLAANMPALTKSTDANNIPVFCGEMNMVAQGGTATYGIEYTNEGRKAGEEAVKILNGESKPEDMAIQYLSADECQLSINKAKAKKFGLKISDELDKSAEYVG